jgi:hypothetical protein
MPYIKPTLPRKFSRFSIAAATCHLMYPTRQTSYHAKNTFSTRSGEHRLAGVQSDAPFPTIGMVSTRMHDVMSPARPATAVRRMLVNGFYAVVYPRYQERSGRWRVVQCEADDNCKPKTGNSKILKLMLSGIKHGWPRILLSSTPNT